MQVSAPRRPSLSTWALHGWIGQSFPDSPASPAESDSATTLGRLAEVPAELAKRGIFNLEVCHFHLPWHRATQFTDLCREAHVRPYQLLIDDGDLSHPETGERDLEWIQNWMTLASASGFERVRVIAGKTTGDGALDQAVSAMERICAHAEKLKLRVVFENWFPLLDTPDKLLFLAAQLGDRAGLCFDFGNWGGEQKYSNLEQIVHLAESCHAKCSYVDGKPDTEDFTRCLEITKEVGFVGPYTLVHGEPGREWETVEEQLRLITPYL